ncbi:MAG: hypothetical protein ACXWU2_14500 [Allosphingosinicella sp.]
MMRLVLIPAVAAALIAVSGQAAPRQERVAFARGASSAELRGVVRGYDYVDYLIGARAGQRMSVTLRRESGQAYFLVRAPGSGENLFDGSIDGDSFVVTLPVSGDYRVRVLMMRAFARRDERSGYRLSVAID